MSERSLFELGRVCLAVLFVAGTAMGVLSVVGLTYALWKDRP